MPKKKFYAVVKGYNKGIYEDWETCKKNTNGFSGAKFKGFFNLEDAEKWYKENSEDISLLSAPVVECEDLNSFCDKYGFEHLNSAQKEAVQTVNGKVLLFAVPGSGKTTVLIARVGYLLYEQKIFPITADRLMNLTFTRAAAEEMKERYKLKFKSADVPAFKTIHSFCWSEIIPALRSKNFPMPTKLVNSDPQANLKTMQSDIDDDSLNNNGDVTMYSILKKVLQRFKLSSRDDTIREKISSVITSIKNRQLTYDEYKDKIVRIKGASYKVDKIFDAYQTELNKRQCMDYDDMLSYSLEGLQQYPDILEEISNKYLYWSIDEAQDNSKLQNDLIALLTSKHGNLFIVGDDDQSIYSFRGAEPQLLLDFSKLDTVKTMVMGTNYRSGKNIVNVAKTFIESNVRRAPKEMQPCENATLGRINFFTKLPEEFYQYRHIVKRAENCIRNGKSLAVIYRLNASSFPVMFWLKKFGIKFNVKKDYREIAYGKVFRDVISLMRFAKAPSDLDAFKSCRYLLSIYLKAEHLEYCEQLMKQHKHIGNLLDWAVEIQPNLKGYISQAKIIIQEINKLSPFEATKYILQNLIEPEPSAASRLRNYAILAACEPYKTIEEFLEAHSELTESAKFNKSNELVTLTSMHSAKGLEFDNVIIIDTWESVMNASFLNEENELDYSDEEEERRLFYVAVTRAKQILDICVVKKYFNNEEEPSTFINELAQSYENAINQPIQELPIKIAPVTFPKFTFQYPQIYYGVRVGRKTGVFERWSEVENSIKGYSGSEYKKCYSLAEAEHYVAEYVKIPLSLNFQRLSEVLHNVQAVSFIRSIDLPESFNRAVLDWFKVSSLIKLRGQRLSNIKSQTISYTDSQETIYHGRVDYYILVYMLVNFYKVWAPLWDILRQRRIKSSLKVLELGAGPGTSMISLIHFYQLLATDNPNQQFTIDYDIVEREEDFVTACKSLIENFMSRSHLSNLNLNCHIVQDDIYHFAESSTNNKDYDLILESNVLNGNENFQQEKTDKLILSLVAKLADEGALILIEPGKNIYLDELKRIGRLIVDYKACLCQIKPRKIKVLVDNITLLKDVKLLGLRNDKCDEHWFSYTIFGKGWRTNDIECK